MQRVIVVGIIALLALAAGVAVAGLPDDVPNDVVGSAIASTTSSVRRQERPTIVATTTTTTQRREPTTTPTTRQPSASRTAAQTTTSPDQTTTALQTTTTLIPADQLRVVVANAGPADLLAARIAEIVRAQGYSTVTVTTANERLQQSTVLYAPGFEGEARQLAATMEVGLGQVQPHPEAPVDESGSPADVWLLVGTDLVATARGIP